MNKTLDFYFDFSSPYSYIAAHRMEALAERHGREVNWKPILLGAIFKVTGQAPLINYPIKGDYAKHDMERSAREHGLPFRIPSQFPIAAIAPARCLLWIRNQPEYAAKAGDFTRAVLDAYYVDDRDITAADTLSDIADKHQIDAQAMLVGVGDDSIKLALREAVDEAMQVGVFGSPTLVVDGEMFWGSDRLEQVDRWLQRGGW